MKLRPLRDQRTGVFKSWAYSGSHALELLEKSGDVLWDWHGDRSAEILA